MKKAYPSECASEYTKNRLAAHPGAVVVNTSSKYGEKVRVGTKNWMCWFPAIEIDIVEEPEDEVDFTEVTIVVRVKGRVLDEELEDLDAIACFLESVDNLKATELVEVTATEFSE